MNQHLLDQNIIDEGGGVWWHAAWIWAWWTAYQLEHVVCSLNVFLLPPKGPPVYETSTLRPVRHRNPELEAESNLFRCMSDASLIKRRREKDKSVAQREKERQHRFSINGHFYNIKVGLCLTFFFVPCSVQPIPSVVHWPPTVFYRPLSSHQAMARQLKYASPAGWPQTRWSKNYYTSSRWISNNIASLQITVRVKLVVCNSIYIHFPHPADWERSPGFCPVLHSPEWRYGDFHRK